MLMRSGAGAGGSGVVMVVKRVREQQVKGQEEEKEEEEEKAWSCGVIPHGPGHLVGLVSPSRTSEDT